MKSIILSIIIPTYNRYDSVLKAIDSIEIEKNNSVEVIVVDDCSKENISKELETRLSKIRNVTYHRNDSNLGLTGNWNKCLEYVSGEWVGLLCDDDEYTDGSILFVLSIIKKQKTPALIITDVTQNFIMNIE